MDPRTPLKTYQSAFQISFLCMNEGDECSIMQGQPNHEQDMITTNSAEQVKRELISFVQISTYVSKLFVTMQKLN